MKVKTYRILKHSLLASVSICSVIMLAATGAQAAAVRGGLGTGTPLPTDIPFLGGSGCDDDCSVQTSVGFNMNFFSAINASTLFVNNNGNVTFGVANTEFIPNALTTTLPAPIIAPFYADVETTAVGSGITNYGQTTLAGRQAFFVNWPGVTGFGLSETRKNTFQLILIDRSDTGAGNFDIEFNYDSIQWDTGTFSDNVSAVAGFSAGTGVPGTFFQIPGSLTPGAFLDSNTATGLIFNTNDGTPGRFVFRVRNGVVSIAPATSFVQETLVSETTEQQVSTSSRRVAAAIDARVDQAIAAAFLSLPGLDQAASAAGIVSGLSGGDTAGNLWGTWATFSPTFLKQSLVLPGAAGAQKVDGTSLSFLAGIDRSLGSRVVAGTFFSYESSDYDIVGTVGERKGKGPLVGAYLGALLADWAYASIQVNHAWLTNRIVDTASGAPVTGKFDSKRFMTSLALTGRKSFEPVTLSTKVGYAYTRENFDGYTASDSSIVSPPSTRLGRVTLGAEVMGNGKVYVPYLSATHEWDVDTTGIGDKNGAVFGGGLRYISGLLSIDLYGSAQAFRSQERAYTLGVNARYAF